MVEKKASESLMSISCVSYFLISNKLSITDWFKKAVQAFCLQNVGMIFDKTIGVYIMAIHLTTHNFR